MFKPAVRQEGKLRMALTGPAGAGKTLTGMRILNALCNSDPWCVYDTENGTAQKYAGYGGFSFDHGEPPLDPKTGKKDHSPKAFIKAITEAYKAGYKGMLIDSLSHEWTGSGGCLEMINTLTANSNSKNSYMQWGTVSPQHTELLGVIGRAPMHIICTLRTKMGYEMQKNERTGKTEPVKIGLEPITRDGVDYEFDLVMDMQEGTGRVTKTRCPQLNETVHKHPGEDVAEIIRAWLQGETPATLLFPNEEVQQEKKSPAKVAMATTQRKKSESTEGAADGSTLGSTQEAVMSGADTQAAGAQTNA